MIWSSENLSNALNLTIPTAFSGNRIQFNSNDVEPSDIFIALPGAKTDGHVYVQDAIKKRCSLCNNQSKPRYRKFNIGT